MDFQPFWHEMKRRNEVAFVTRDEHARLGITQRSQGINAYSIEGIKLVRVDPRAMGLAGYKARLVREFWPSEDERAEAMDIEAIGLVTGG